MQEVSVLLQLVIFIVLVISLVKTTAGFDGSEPEYKPPPSKIISGSDEIPDNGMILQPPKEIQPPKPSKELGFPYVLLQSTEAYDRKCVEHQLDKMIDHPYPNTTKDDYKKLFFKACKVNNLAFCKHNKVCPKITKKRPS